MGLDLLASPGNGAEAQRARKPQPTTNDVLAGYGNDRTVTSESLGATLPSPHFIYYHQPHFCKATASAR